LVTGNASPIDVLKKSKVVAVVGASKNPEKESHTVPRYLKEQGYHVIPVNPTSQEILGERAYPALKDLPDDLVRTVDVVEVFRPSDELPQVALQVVELKKRTGRPVVFWAQQGLENEEAKRVLEENGIPYVMDGCMRAIHQIHVRKTA
jgi:predicted CoA-binding protein